MKTSLLVILLLCVSAGASAQDVSANPRFDDFYTVSDQSTSDHDTPPSFNPADVAQEIWNEVQDVYELRGAVLSLISINPQEK